MNAKYTKYIALLCAIIMFSVSSSGCVIDLSSELNDISYPEQVVEQVSVPGVVSLSVETAADILAKAGLTYCVKEEKSDSAEGTVILQYPANGEKIDKGGQVTLVVSIGNGEESNQESTQEIQESTPENIKQNTSPIVQESNNNVVLVKNFVGQSIDSAKSYYESNGLTVKYDEVYTNSYSRGIVIWQSLMPSDSDSYVEKGETISFQVSAGSAATVTSTPAARSTQRRVASFSKVSASSVLPDEGVYTYIPENILNFNGKCWTEDKSGVGIGEYVEFKNSNPVTVSSCGVVNGYTLDYERFTNNGRLTKVKFQGDDKSYTFNIDSNSMQEQIFEFPEPMYTRSLKIIIADAISGTKYSDTCISVIIPYQ